MKQNRQEKIKELVTKYEIETQEDLARMLREAGYNVTQATVSRDIRELKLSKVSVAEGKQKYVIISGHESQISDKYIRVLKDGFVSRDIATQLIVIKTVTGMAMAVATAIDHMNIPGIVGCIAGDDVIMCAISSAEETEHVKKMIDQLMQSKP